MLRDFDTELFQTAHCLQLQVDNDGVEKLSEVTLQEWKRVGQDSRTVQQ